MVKVAICDDEVLMVEEIESYIQELSSIYSKVIETEIFYSGEDFCKRLDNGCDFDIIFMDIEMNKLNGIDAIKKLRENNYYTLVIYVSSKQNYYKELFEVQPFQFILKPINKEEFFEKFNLAYKRVHNKNYYFEFIIRTTVLRIPIKDIIYFESCKRCIILETIKGSYKFYMKLSKIKDELEDHYFLHLHQSYLVNLEYIKEMHYDYVVLFNDKVISISERKRKAIREEYANMIKKIKCNG